VSKFFQSEIAAYSGERSRLQQVEFRKSNLENSVGASAGTLLEIMPLHIKNPPVIQFVAYMTNFTDTHDVMYGEEGNAYGRPDSWHIWKKAQRKITVSWDIPASSISKGLDNLNNISWLLASMYPTYKDSEVATSIAASPLFRVRYANLIRSPTQGGLGILCAIKNFSFTTDVTAGWIPVHAQNMGSNFANLDARVLQEAGFDSFINEGDRLLIPKLFDATLQLEIINDHPVGWDYATGEWRGGKSGSRYPYSLGLQKESGGEGAATAGPSTAPGAPGAIVLQNAVDDIFDSPDDTEDAFNVNIP